MKVVWASDRLRRWYGAAALASLGVPAVLLHALRVTDWYLRHPVMAPGDDSPGGGMGYLLDAVVLVLATPVSLLVPVLWLVARHRAGHGGPFLRAARLAAALLVVLTLLTLPVAARLPHGWADVTALLAACPVGLAAATVPPRRVAAWAAAAAAAAQNQA